MEIWGYQGRHLYIISFRWKKKKTLLQKDYRLVVEVLEILIWKNKKDVNPTSQIQAQLLLRPKSDRQASQRRVDPGMGRVCHLPAV